MNMKIWIVGSSGMLGSTIFSALLSQNIETFGTDSKEVDITSFENIENYVEDKNFTHIINCSAYTKVDEAERNEKLAYGINAYGVKNLAKVSRNIKAKVLHFSTDYVFSGDKNSPYAEEDVPSPKTIYGKSKLLGEEFLLSEAIDPCIIRTSWLFGAKGKNFVKTMIDQLQKKEELQVVSDQRGRPTFCEDLAQAAISVLSFSGIFHFANDLALSWYDLTKIIFEKLEPFGEQSLAKIRCKKIVPVLSKNYPTFATRPAYSVLSTKKIENTLQIKAPSLLCALEKYISSEIKGIKGSLLQRGPSPF